MTLRPNVTPDPYAGQLIAGALWLETVIGVGTTGRVYRAKQLGLDRDVAVKILHPFLVQTPGIKERFHREARLLAQLIHPSIVRVLGSGDLPATTNTPGGETYLVYEYLNGQTLRDRLLSKSQPNVNEAVGICITLAAAISEAHHRQIVHRDLKPENVMSVNRGDGESRYVVLDFGLARALDGDSDPLTRTGAILGTPQYMAPEVAHGEPASPHSDVYALATILYEMLTGHPPFYTGSPVAILIEQVNTPVPPFAPSLPIPLPLADFVMKNLSKARTSRCPDAECFANQLFEVSLTSNLAPFVGLPSHLVALANAPEKSRAFS
jgi:serine/threonine-protein kinase